MSVPRFASPPIRSDQAGQLLKGLADPLRL